LATSFFFKKPSCAKNKPFVQRIVLWQITDSYNRLSRLSFSDVVAGGLLGSNMLINRLNLHYCVVDAMGLINNAHTTRWNAFNIPASYKKEDELAVTKKENKTKLKMSCQIQKELWLVMR